MNWIYDIQINWNLVRVGKQKLKLQVKQNLHWLQHYVYWTAFSYGQDVKRFN